MSVCRYRVLVSSLLNYLSLMLSPALSLSTRLEYNVSITKHEGSVSFLFVYVWDVFVVVLFSIVYGGINVVH